MKKPKVCDHGVVSPHICDECAKAFAYSFHLGDTSPTPPVTANPKDAAASNKAPLHLVPAAFKAYTAMALAEGAMKYGAWNWRVSGVKASVYRAALDRHMDKWFNGEWFDPKTGVPHLANAAACLAVIIDAVEQGELIDDRPPAQESLPGLFDDDVPDTIAGLREVFGHLTPTHYTISDVDLARQWVLSRAAR